MNKRLSQFQEHYKRSKAIAILFILDLLFIVLSFFSAVIHTSYSLIFIIIFLTIEIFLMIHTIVFSAQNLVLVNNLEEYFFNKSYGTSALKVHHFHDLLEKNLFDYYFQPIIDAKTGVIFAYEALMRSNQDNIGMLPVEILDLAAKDNRLYDLEKRTFENTLKLMRQYSDVFQNKKLFINSISNHPLTNEDFQILYSEYGPLFQSVVMEISAASSLNEAGKKQIQDRLQKTGCQLALDDYGAGFLNESNLQIINPGYLKIDRYLLKNINIDTKKQHLVTNLIHFAKQNNIKTIADGIEYFEEFEFVINLGVDYIQGFYTAKPEHDLIDVLPEDIIRKIQRINYRKFCETSMKKIYETRGETTLFPAKIASEKYSAIVIYEEKLILKGLPGTSAELSLMVPDNHKCELIFDRISIDGTEKPTLILGNSSTVTVRLIGDNYLLNNGIRVPESADLTILGDGDLTLRADHSGRIGIGGSDVDTYGNITLATTGKINVLCNGNTPIGIGGGQNPSNSTIRLLSGNITVGSVGYTAVGIGSQAGNARVEIGRCQLTVKAEGVKVTGIGSITGAFDIVTSGNLNVRCVGKSSVAIGAIEDCDGTVTVEEGRSDICCNAGKGSVIGSISGKVRFHILGGDLVVSGEGKELIGIGDCTGLSELKISGGVLAIRLLTANAPLTGCLPSKIIIDGGNVQCDFPEDVFPVNSFGAPLEAHIVTDTNEFCQVIETLFNRYEYKASYSRRYPFIKVYLPEYTVLN